MKLLVIRPQPGADATATRVRDAGHQPLVMPIFSIRALAWDVPDASHYDAILLTSGNAVRMAAAGLQALSGLPVHAVGAATAAAAREAGLEVAGQGSSDAAALLHSLGPIKLLWLCGQDRSELPVVDGVTVDAVPVYESAPLPATRDFLKAIERADFVLLHSVRAAGYFAAVCDGAECARADISLAAFSPAVARAAGSGLKNILTSPEPNDAALLSQLSSS